MRTVEEEIIAVTRAIHALQLEYDTRVLAYVLGITSARCYALLRRGGLETEESVCSAFEQLLLLALSDEGPEPRVMFNGQEKPPTCQ